MLWGLRVPLAMLLAGALVAAGGGSSQAQEEDSESRERRAIKKEVQAFWQRENYDALDALAKTYRTGNARTRSGYFLLDIYYEALVDRRRTFSAADFPGGKDWKKIEAWAAAKPASPAPVITKALYLIEQSEKTFGAYSVTATSPSVKATDFLQEARKFLDANKSIAAKDPHFYTALLKVRRLQGEPIETLLLQHAEALDAHPHYLPTHAELFSYLVRRWHPDLKRIDAFANTVLERTKATEGDALYARLYEHAFPAIHAMQPFDLAGLNWKRIKSGYERIRASYPEAWNVNKFAYFACLADDRDAIRNLMPEVGKKIVREAWGSPVMLQLCMARVQRSAELPALRL